MRTLLDTNVLSEARKSGADPRVVRRFQEATPGSMYVSAVTIGEIVYGIFRLAPGRKRTALETWLAGIERQYADRVLPVDVETSRIWGEIAASCEAMGKKISAQDGLIAATALRHGMHLMTRNTKNFAAAGVLLINPWED